MPSYFPTRGCVYTVQDEGGGSGLYNLPGISDLKGEGYAVLLNGADLGDEDLVFPVSTINGTKILYVFGENFGNVHIAGQALMGEAKSSSHVLSRIIAWFQEHRVSKSKRAINFSMDGQGYQLYITGLVVGAADPEFNIQNFAIVAMIASPP